MADPVESVSSGEGSEDKLLILEKLDQEFKNRYTDDDPDYRSAGRESIPPCIENSRSFGRGRGGYHGNRRPDYRHHGDRGGGRHGNGDSGRYGDRSWQHGGGGGGSNRQGSQYDRQRDYGGHQGQGHGRHYGGQGHGHYDR